MCIFVALHFALFFFFWLRENLIGHVYILHFSLHFTFPFTELPFVHPASHKRLCLQTLDLTERKVDYTCLYFALFQCWLDMFTCCTFFEREKLMGNVYILREKMIGHVYILQLFSPFNFFFHWTQYLLIQVLIKCT